MKTLTLKIRKLYHQQTNPIKRQKSITWTKKGLYISIPVTKSIAKLGSIVIVQVNTEVWHIAYVI